MKLIKNLLMIGTFLLVGQPAQAFELFGKGSASRTMHDTDVWTLNVRASGGFAFHLLKGVRFEARYTNMSSLQNRLDISDGSITGTVTDLLTETQIFSGGLSIDLFSGRRSRFKPYIVMGAGYSITRRTYEFAQTGDPTTTLLSEPEKKGLSANGGLGFQWQLARSFAIDVEGICYVTDLDDPQPLINVYASLGIRFFL